VFGLRVEYAERGTKYGILFIFSLFDEYSPLEYVRVPVIYRIYQAEYVILIVVAVSQEYVNTYSTPRVFRAWLLCFCDLPSCFNLNVFTLSL